jgi:chorismate synthase
MKGSEHNDLHNSDGTTKRIFPRYSGWNQQWYGHFFRVAFKPVAIMQKQESLDNQGTQEMTGKDVMIHVWSREQCLSLKQWLRLY